MTKRTRYATPILEPSCNKRLKDAFRIRPVVALPGATTTRTTKRLLFEPGRVRHSRARSARVVSSDAEFGAEKCVSRRSRAHDDASASTRVSRARLSSRARRSRSPPSPEPVRTSPADSKFTQQELPAWRPTLTPAWVRLPRALPRPSGVYVRAARAARRALPEDALAPGGVVSFSPQHQNRRDANVSGKGSGVSCSCSLLASRARTLTSIEPPPITRSQFPADVRDPVRGGVRVRSPGRGVLRRGPKRR